MTTIWTPSKQPPNPKDVFYLSSDARRILEALRTAYHKKCQEQKQRSVARRTSTSQQTSHYRTSQTPQHDNVISTPRIIKQELCTADSMPASPPLSVDYMPHAPAIASPSRQSSMLHIQNDNSHAPAVASSLRQSSMPHIQNDNTAVISSSLEQSSHSDNTAVISSSVPKQSSTYHPDNVVASSLSLITHDVTSSLKHDSSVTPIQNEYMVVRTSSLKRHLVTPIHDNKEGVTSARQTTNTAHHGCNKRSACTFLRKDATNSQTHNFEQILNSVNPVHDKTVGTSPTRQTSNMAYHCNNNNSACIVPRKDTTNFQIQEHILKDTPSAQNRSSHDTENRDASPSLLPTCADTSARSATCKTFKSSSCSSDTSRPSLLQARDDCSKQLKCLAQKTVIEKDGCCSDIDEQHQCEDAHLSPTYPARQLGHEISKQTSRKRKTISSALQGSGSAKKPLSSFQTPFKDVGESKSRHFTDDSSNCHCDMDKKKGESSHKSFRDSFVNLSKLHSDKDKKLIEEKMKKAVEVVMTLVYTDKTSQLRESNQAKSSNVDDTVKGIAACIYHHKDMVEQKESIEGSVDSMEKCYVLFSLGDDGNDNQWASEIFIEIMRRDVRKICFDAKELMHYTIVQYKLQLYRVCCQWQLLDPKTAAWLLDPDNPPITFSDVLQICRDLDKQSLKNLNSENKVHPMCKDLQLLSWCMQVLYKSLQKKQLWDLFISVETKLTPILAAMEVQGIRVNTKVLKVHRSKLKARIDDLESEAHKAAGCSFQVSSHVQLRQILFDQLKLDQKLQGKKLARTNVQNLKSTSEAVLSKLQDFHPLPKIVLQYRQLMKLNSTYVDGLLGFVTNESLHTSWEQTSASTGRVQSASPNIQNIPKQPIDIGSTRTADDSLETSDGETIWAREPFVSQSGCTLIAADFQSIELRLLAHMSGDRVLLKVFNNKDCMDVFVELASEWLGMKPSEVTTSDREKTKRIVYSVIYGVGPERLAETLQVTKEEAKSFMKSFLNKFKGVSSFSHRCVSTCQRHNGEVRTIFNRLRLVPNINSNNFHARSYAERQAVNFVVQGSAADICKIAMIQVMHRLSAEPHLQARLLVQIHDELLLEVPDVHVDQVKDILKKVMEDTGTLCGQKVSLKVPLPISVSQGKSWGHLVTS